MRAGRRDNVKPYHLRLTFEVHVAPWRIDDPNSEENAEWSLAVFDKSIGEWVNMNLCTRPGEDSYLINIEVIEDKASS